MEEKEIVQEEQTTMETAMEENNSKAEKEVKKFVKKTAKRKVCIYQCKVWST